MLLYKSIDKYIEEFEKKKEKYEREFQGSGSLSSKRTAEKYEDLVEICVAAKNAQSEEDKIKTHIRNNVRNHIDRIENRKLYERSKQYSIDELLDELRKIERLI